MKLFGRSKAVQEQTMESVSKPEEVQVHMEEEETEAGEGFRMLIENVVSIVGKGCVVLGTVTGAAIHKNQKVIIRRKNGDEISARIHGIELHEQTAKKSAEVGQAVGIVLEGITKAQVSIGDRLLGAVSEKTLSSIKNTSTFYVLYMPKTALPLIIMECAEVYTSMEYASQGVEHYKDIYPGVEVKEIPWRGSEETDGLPIFQYFGYLGIDDIIIDDGVTGVTVRRRELMGDLDMVHSGEENLVRNPNLRLQMSNFIAQLESKGHYEGVSEMLKQSEQTVIEGMKAGTFLMASQEDQSVALLADSNGNRFVPVFTDSLEYKKLFTKDDWKQRVCTFAEVASIAAECKGTVINPLGENMTLDNEMLGRLFQVQS